MSESDPDGVSASPAVNHHKALLRLHVDLFIYFLRAVMTF